MGDSSPQTSPTRVLPLGCSSSRHAPARVLPTGCSPSGTGCSSVGPHGITSPASKLLWRGLLPPRVRRSWQDPAPVWAPHRVTASFKHPPAPAWGPFHGLQVEICSTVDLHGLQGDSLPHCGLHHELQEKAFCSNVSSTSSPSFFTDLGVCKVVSLTSSHSSLLTAVSLSFFLLLNYVITAALPQLLIGLALASSGSVFVRQSSVKPMFKFLWDCKHLILY